jgi:hypothetical protein
MRMAKSRATLTTGTARDLAEHDTGYSGNGESIYTRQAARTGRGVLLKGQVANETRGSRPRHVIIRENEAQLSKLRCELLVESDAGRRSILKNIGIKTNFLEKMRNEST